MTNGSPQTPPAYSSFRRAKSSCKRVMQRGVTSLSTGLWHLSGRQLPSSLNILCHHRVVPVPPGVSLPPWNVTPHNFREQLIGLRNAGYEFWPLSRVLGYQSRREPFPKQVIVLTFDDGYENNYTHAWPIMRELDVPGTIFLNTAYLDSDEPFPFEPWGIANAERTPAEMWRPLTRTQCHEMLASGLIELGAHTHTHQDFRGREQDFTEDLRTNVEQLRHAFGRDEITFAFPYGCSYLGYTAADLVRAAQNVGVLCALTTDCKPVDPFSDPFDWGRCTVYDWDSADTLSAKFAGWYRWAFRGQERLSALQTRLSNAASAPSQTKKRNERIRQSSTQSGHETYA